MRAPRDAMPPAATISAQPGPQSEFLRRPADICIYGGAAGVAQIKMGPRIMSEIGDVLGRHLRHKIDEPGANVLAAFINESSRKRPEHTARRSFCSLVGIAFVRAQCYERLELRRRGPDVGALRLARGVEGGPQR
jgi:hypothetical protein